MYGVMTIEKYKRSSVKGIQYHVMREGESTTNPDIDPAKTCNNYGYVKSYDYCKYINERTSCVKRKIRKDAVVMFNILFSASPEFFSGLSLEDEKKFFEDCVRFVFEKFGQDNVIAAVVHKDEKTSHMHVVVVPVTDDGRLSASDYFDGREKMESWQKLVYDDVFAKWGLQKCKSTKETKRKRIETVEYKVQQASNELELIEDSIIAAQDEYHDYEMLIDVVDQELKEKNKRLVDLDKIVREKELECDKKCLLFDKKLNDYDGLSVKLQTEIGKVERAIVETEDMANKMSKLNERGAEVLRKAAEQARNAATQAAKINFDTCTRFDRPRAVAVDDDDEDGNYRRMAPRPGR